MISLLRMSSNFSLQDHDGMWYGSIFGEPNIKFGGLSYKLHIEHIYFWWTQH